MYEYGYLIGCLILFIPWFLVFMFKPNNRKRILFSGLLGIPFGLTESFYIPEYWNPPATFDLINKMGFGIESILFAFFVGGLASVVFEIFKTHITEVGNWSIKGFSIYVISYVIYLLCEIIFPNSTIYNMSFIFILLSIWVNVYFKNYFIKSFYSGVVFMIIYSLLFVTFLKIFPEYILSIYNLDNFLGIWVFGLPIEEPFFAFSVGLFWSILYDISFSKEKLV